MTLLDTAVIAAWALAILWIGLRVGRRPASSRDFMLAGRRLPTWAVLCSLVATELSAATFIGVPHAAYTGDWFYLELALGALLGKLVLASSVVPLYHRMRIVTVYGFLRERFDADVQRASALAFVVGRILASGVRLFIAALALCAVTAIPIELAIACCALVAGLYTLRGGIRAVVWTDTLQAVLLLGSALLVLAVLVSAAGGPLALVDWAQQSGRMRIFHATPIFSLSDGRSLGTAVLGAFFLTLATHATDHDMVQRLLTTRDGRAGGRALMASALLNFPISLLFLAIGTGLAHFYSTPPDYEIADSARILPLFALHELPSGARGLLFAGLFAAALSSLDSAICALATTWVSDVRTRAAPTDDAVSESADTAALRRSSLVFSALLSAAAVAMAHYQRLLQRGTGAGLPLPSLVELALSAMTILYGALLGVFALGLLTRRRGSRTSVRTGLAVGVALGFTLFLQPLVLDRSAIAWPWWIPISAAVTFCIGAAGRRASVTSLPEAGGN